MDKKELLVKLRNTLSITEIQNLKLFFEDIDIDNEDVVIVKKSSIKDNKKIAHSSLNTAFRFLCFSEILEISSLGNLGSRFLFKDKELLKTLLDKEVL